MNRAQSAAYSQTALQNANPYVGEAGPCWICDRERFWYGAEEHVCEACKQALDGSGPWWARILRWVLR